MTARFIVACVAVLAGSGATAAERPVFKPALAAIEGLKDCPNGGFALPGSSTCIRLNGSVTATTILRSGGSSTPRENLFSSHVVGRVSADVRMQTEMGPLRAYTSLRVPLGEDANGHR